MLNGDVLTDMDLRAQIAQHERSGAPRHARAGAGRGSDARTASCGIDDDGAVRGFLEKPQPGARSTPT